MEEYTEVFVWGSDNQGQLGLGSKSTKSVQKVPKLCSFNILIEQISCGEEHSALISQTGYVYTMGSNLDGRLGIGTKSITHSTSPCLVEELAKYKAKHVSSGWAHSVVLTDKGEGFAWGLGEYGALGTGSTETQWSPGAVLLPDIAFEVSCGSRHTGFVLNSDLKYNLFMCGAGESGQLGTGGREKELTPISVLTEDPVKQVSCGIFQTGIITIKNKVYMTGGNSFGQLGLGNRKGKSCFEKVEALSGINVKKLCCSNFSAALTEKGGVYVWGSGSFGECLVPYKLHSSVQFKDLSIGTGFAILLDNENTLYSFGGNSEGELGCDDEIRTNPQVVQSLKSKQIEKIACGSKFSLALGTDFLPRRMRETRSKKNVTKDLVNKSFEDLKTIHNKSLQNFRVERNKNLQLIENLETNVQKFKLDVKKIDKSREILERENQDVNQKIEEFKVKNLDLQQQLFIYKEKFFNLQQKMENEKNVWKGEVAKCEEKLIGNQKAIKDLLNMEIMKNSQIKSELEMLKQENQVLVGTVKRYQNVKSEFNEESKRVLRVLESEKQKLESEKQKLRSELESCQGELKNLKSFRIEAGKKEVEACMAQVVEQKKSLDFMQDEISMLKTELSLKTREFQNEKIHYERELSIMSSKYSNLSKENTEIQENSKKTLQELLGTNDSLTKDLLTYKSLTEKLETENQSLSSQVSILALKNSENSLHDLQDLLSTNNSLTKDLLTYKSLTEKLETENKSLSSQVSILTLKNSEKSLHDLQELLSTNNSLTKDLLYYKSLTEKLETENQSLNNQVSVFTLKNSSSKSNKNSKIQDLTTKLSEFERENEGLLSQLLLKSQEIKDLELKSSKFMHENNFLKQNIEELRQELDENKENKGSLSAKCDRLTKENRDLRVQVSEMEGKNQEIFSNLEKDLAYKAKVYKERTISLLNGVRSSATLSQVHGTENSERPRSPFIQPEGNPAASLLTVIDRSPTPNRSSTPTRDSVKARITELLRDKTQIEAQLSNCKF